MSGIQVRALFASLGYEFAPGAKSKLRKYKQEGTKAGEAVGKSTKKGADTGRDALGRLTASGKKGFKELSQGGSSFANVLGGIKNLAASATLILGGALAAGISFVVRELVAANAEFENLDAQLVTVTGSQEAANEAFKKLEGFAARTPFQLAEVVRGFSKLKALGLDPSESALESYGNTASAMGKTLNDMIEAVADASTGEFERLKEFGIKASSQGKKVTFTFKGIKTTVGKNAKEIEAYLRNLGNTEFAGGMERQSKTIGGLWSTAKDSFASFLRTIGKSGFNEGLKELIGVLTEGGAAAGNLAKSIGNALGRGLNMAAQFVRLLRENWDTIKKIGVAVSALVIPWIGLGLLLQDFMVYLRGGESLIGKFFARFEAGKGPVGFLVRLLKAAITNALAARQAFINMFSGGTVEGPLGRVRDIAMKVFGWLRDNGPAIFERVKSVAVTVLGAVISAFQWLQSITGRVFAAIKSVAVPLFQVIKAIAIPIIKAIVLWFYIVAQVGIWLWGSVLWPYLIKPLVEGLVWLLEILAKVASWWIEQWVPVFETVWGWIEKIIDGIAKLVGIDFGALSAKFDSFFGTGDGAGAPGGNQAAAANAGAVFNRSNASSNQSNVVNAGGINVTVQTDSNASPGEIGQASANAVGGALGDASKGLARNRQGGAG